MVNQQFIHLETNGLGKRVKNFVHINVHMANLRDQFGKFKKNNRAVQYTQSKPGRFVLRVHDSH